MTVFYENFINLCAKKGIAPTKAAVEMGLSRGTPSFWKNRGTIPQDTQLSKIADYFGVDCAYLLAEHASGQKEKDASQEINLESVPNAELFSVMAEVAKLPEDKQLAVVQLLHSALELYSSNS